MVYRPNYKSLGSEERRQRVKEALESEEEKNKIKAWWDNHAKNLSDDELLDLLNYQRYHFSSEEEWKQARKKVLQETPREELEREVAGRGYNIQIQGLRFNANEPTYEEYQRELKEDHATWGGAYKLECQHCGREFYARYPLARYCTYRCTNDAYIKKRKEKKERMRNNRICVYCKKKFPAKRTDAKYCCKSHRVLGCYVRKKGKKLEGEEFASKTYEAMRSGFKLIS